MSSNTSDVDSQDNGSPGSDSRWYHYASGYDFDDESIGSGSGSPDSVNTQMFVDLPPASSTPDLSLSGSSPHAGRLSVFSSDYSPEAYPDAPVDTSDEPRADDNDSEGPSSAFLQCLDRLLSELKGRSNSSCSDDVSDATKSFNAFIRQSVSAEEISQFTAGTYENSPGADTPSGRASGVLDSSACRSSHEVPHPAHALSTRPSSMALSRSTASDSGSLKRKLSASTGSLETRASRDGSQYSSGLSVESEDPASDSFSPSVPGGSNRNIASIGRGAAYIKRRRLTRDSLGAPSDKSPRIYAAEPASLRKARSLRSEASLGEKRRILLLRALTPTQPNHTSVVHTREDASGLESLYAPTVPASPALSPRFDPPALLLPVPPAEYILRPPICAEDAAQRRLDLLLEREANGLDFSGLRLISPFAVISEQRSTSGSNSESDSEDITEYSVSEDEASVTCGSQDCSSDGGMTDSDAGVSQSFDTDIQDGLRTEAMETRASYTQVVPPYDSGSVQAGKPSIYSKDLYDQLMFHPDTRFLAAYLFGRYFLSIADGKSDDGASSQDVGGAKLAMSAVRYDGKGDIDLLRQMELDEGERRLVWDFAVAAVTLSVKSNRDFLPPLRPIYARDFLVLAPHDMCYDDLEHAQRDILETLSYRLAIPTPQNFMDELYILLPALRRLIGCCGWEKLKNMAWKQLLAAIREPDVFRFPISVLTAAVLQLGIGGEGYGDKHRAGCCCSATVNNAGRGPSAVKIDDRYILHLKNGILKDIQQLLRVSQITIDSCKRWLAPLRVNANTGIEWFDHASST
ncbi:hypothetical protein EVG20_g3015 [Dentipellis fragilis]|uniref:Uncharacterized protein n=1 Tax=Dentipellis fragilis TaxID=205917 RepID=A0A4Y9Z5E3_9AGAM|nr:hypothetical protein EVG20_g3015 [Dentipellis fragilis]